MLELTTPKQNLSYRQYYCRKLKDYLATNAVGMQNRKRLQSEVDDRLMEIEQLLADNKSLSQAAMGEWQKHYFVYDLTGCIRELFFSREEVCNFLGVWHFIEGETIAGHWKVYTEIRNDLNPHSNSMDLIS